jgi:hypothetical protein
MQEGQVKYSRSWRTGASPPPPVRKEKPVYSIVLRYTFSALYFGVLFKFHVTKMVKDTGLNKTMANQIEVSDDAG